MTKPSTNKKRSSAYSRNVGGRFERECRDWVRSCGFDCIRSAQVKQNNNAFDLTSEDFPWAVECKWRANYSINQAWDDLMLTASHSRYKPPMVLWRHCPQDYRGKPKQEMMVMLNLAGLKPLPSLSEVAFLDPINTDETRGRFWNLADKNGTRFISKAGNVFVFGGNFFREVILNELHKED